jgi:hypothetical protein
MTRETAIKLFNEHRIHTHWDDKEEKWYFSIVDVVFLLPKLNHSRCGWLRSPENELTKLKTLKWGLTV